MRNVYSLSFCWKINELGVCGLHGTTLLIPLKEIYDLQISHKLLLMCPSGDI